MNKLVLIISLTFMGIIYVLPKAFAENKPSYVVSGHILEYSTENPLPYVTITLNSKQDSTLVSGTISDQDGFFEFKKIQEGDYFLQLSFVGFQTLVIEDLNTNNKSKKINLGELIMNPVETILDEVLVKAKASPLSSTIDKQVINADQNIIASGGNAVDLLRNSGSVEITSDDEVKLRGSNKFIVLVDGKPSVLSSNDLLKSTPANQISKIEIITNPPVKYSAEGGSGVINIIMKKGIPNSLNALVNLSAGSKNKYGGDLQVNWNAKKLSLSGAVDWKDNQNLAYHDYYRNYNGLDTNLHSTLMQERKFNTKNLGLRFGLNYDPNESTNLHYSLHSGMNQILLDVQARTHGNTISGEMEKYNYNIFELNQKPTFFTNNLGFTKKIGSKGSQFSADAYYSFIDYYFLTSQEMAETNSDYVYLNDEPYLQDVTNNNYSNDIRLTADMNQALGKNIFLEYGLSWHNYLRSLDVVFAEFDYPTDSWVNHPDYTHKYDFDESVYAAYTSVKGQWLGSNFSAGIRGEYMDRYLIQKEEGINYEYSKMNWFPSFSISRNMGNKHDVGLAFSNRINRPDEYALNPYPEYEDDYFFSEGNPNLIPEIIRNLEMNYRFVHQDFVLSSNIFLRMTEDKIEQMMVEDESGKLILTYHNDASDRTIGYEMMGNFNFFPFWSLNANGSVYHHLIWGNVAEEEIRKTNFSWKMQMVNSFNLTKKTSLQLINYYQSKTQNLQYDVKGFHFMDVGLNHKFLDGKLTVGLKVKDVFDSVNLKIETRAQNTLLNAYFNKEARVVLLNVSYQINQYKKQTKDVNTEFDM